VVRDAAAQRLHGDAAGRLACHGDSRLRPDGGRRDDDGNDDGNDGYDDAGNWVVRRTVDEQGTGGGGGDAPREPAERRVAVRINPQLPCRGGGGGGGGGGAPRERAQERVAVSLMPLACNCTYILYWG